MQRFCQERFAPTLPGSWNDNSNNALPVQLSGQRFSRYVYMLGVNGLEHRLDVHDAEFPRQLCSAAANAFPLVLWYCKHSAGIYQFLNRRF